MINVRYNFFETNSSSTMTFAVDICQVENLDIPPVVKIESNESWWERNLNGCYAWAKRDNDEEAFFGLLAYVGVKEIYVDGRPVEANKDNHHIKFTREEMALAICFGDFKSYSEWMGHGDEWDNSQFLSKEQIKTVQTFIKNPNYVVICMDEDGNEIDWFSTRYSKMIITDEDVEKERKFLEYQKRYDEDREKYDSYEDYEEAISETADFEEEDYEGYYKATNRHKKNRK